VWKIGFADYVLSVFPRKAMRKYRPTLVELRDALHMHIERMRERSSPHPFLVERATEMTVRR
jgi:hypothetical protein